MVLVISVVVEESMEDVEGVIGVVGVVEQDPGKNINRWKDYTIDRSWNRIKVKIKIKSWDKLCKPFYSVVCEAFVAVDSI